MVFWAKSLGKNGVLYIHLAYKFKHVDRFRKGSVHELYCLKASQVSRQSSRLKPSRSRGMSANYENTYNNSGESMTVCGYCCYYLEHCNKTNHIAIKRVVQMYLAALANSFRKLCLTDKGNRNK